MKIKAHAGLFTLLAAALLIASSCASTRVTSDWKDESYVKKPGKILVLALLNDGAQRRLMEDELVSQLKSEGIDAIPGYTVLPEGKPQDKEVIAAKVREVGADTLLLTRLVDKKTVQEYVPGTPYYPPTAYHDWYGYYGGFYPAYPGYARGYAPGGPPPYPPGYPPGYSPGYTTETVYNIAEANLYDAATGKIVWSARTESQAQGNDERAIKSYVSQIMKSLRKQNVIP